MNIQNALAVIALAASGACSAADGSTFPPSPNQSYCYTSLTCAVEATKDLADCEQHLPLNWTVEDCHNLFKEEMAHCTFCRPYPDPFDPSVPPDAFKR